MEILWTQTDKQNAEPVDRETRRRRVKREDKDYIKRGSKGEENEEMWWG
jgi:hypothetical protein